MKRALFFAVGAALLAGVSTFPVQAALGAPAKAVKASVWKVSHNSFGQPDLTGYWSNVSMTPESRPPTAKGATYTLEEAHRAESADAEAAVNANKPIDPNEGKPTAGGTKAAPGERPEFTAAGGGTGGYDRGWLDPGTGYMRVNGQPRTGILTTPDGKVPATITGKREAAYRGGLGSFDNPEDRQMGERCIMGFGRNAGPPMLANGFYNNDYQIVQTKDQIDIQIEMIHDVRQIRLNSTHRTDGIRPQMGDSIGHFEGDTLVVETTNIPQVQAYHGSWKDLTVTERFTRVGPDRLHYSFTIHDPTLWAADWGGEYEFHPLKGVIYEYACHEGNYALEHILAGARADEQRAKQSKGS